MIDLQAVQAQIAMFSTAAQLLPASHIEAFADALKSHIRQVPFTNLTETAILEQESAKDNLKIVEAFLEWRKTLDSVREREMVRIRQVQEKQQDGKIITLPTKSGGKN